MPGPPRWRDIAAVHPATGVGGYLSARQIGLGRAVRGLENAAAEDSASAEMLISSSSWSPFCPFCTGSMKRVPIVTS